MVMFNNIVSALDGANQPRKTDILLQPGVAQETQPQGGSALPASAPASTAITNEGSTAAAGGPAKGPQAQRSPQQVLDTNSNVEIGNAGAKAAQVSADNIAKNQVTELAKYQPAATTNVESAKKYIAEGKPEDVWQVQDFKAAAPAKADMTALDSVSGSFSSDPYKGVNNALDRALALKSGTFTQQGKEAQDAVANSRRDVSTAADAATGRYTTAKTASEADIAALKPTVTGLQKEKVTPLEAELARRNKNEDNAQVAAQADARVMAETQAGSWLTQANPENGNWSKFPGMDQAFKAFTLGKLDPATTYRASQGGKSTIANVVTPAQAAELNRIQRVLGQPETYSANGTPLAKATPSIDPQAIAAQMPQLWAAFKASGQFDNVIDVWKANGGVAGKTGSGAAVLGSQDSLLNTVRK